MTHIPSYNVEWRRHLSELLDLQMSHIPRGSVQPVDAEPGLQLDENGMVRGGNPPGPRTLSP